MASPAANNAGTEGEAAATASVNACLHWDGGACALRLRSSSRGPPIRAGNRAGADMRRPLLSCLLKLHIEQYFLEDGRRLCRRTTIPLPIRLAAASRFATLRGAAEAVVSDVVTGYRDLLPDEARHYLSETLPLYIRNVAAARAGAEAAPLLTEVHGDIRVSMLVEEDEEEEGDDHGEDGQEDNGEVPPTAARAETTTVDGQPAQGNEEEEETCAICLGTLAGARRYIWWLPCLHVFHGDCVRGWLRRAGQCPLCRLGVIPPCH